MEEGSELGVVTLARVVSVVAGVSPPMHPQAIAKIARHNIIRFIVEYFPAMDKRPKNPPSY
jgi:hypothetical protein